MGIQGLVIPFQRIADKTRNLADLADAMAAMTTDLGFQHFALTPHTDPTDKAIRLHNYPAVWVDYYDSKGFWAFDPVHRRSHLNTKGFRWSEMSALEPLDGIEREIMRLSEEHGIGDGYTVPAHIPGEPATCTFVNATGRPAFPHHEYLARLAGTAAFEAIRRLVPRSRARAPLLRPPLTARQIVILRLVRHGKTDAEIGILLGISEKTVASHIRDLFERYGVNKRTLLISCAYEDGYLM